ncbi:RNA dependent RNA polymerase-domain-containing protein [Kalaharituber pfeilii]|nr:RNA dependent RNA polymerase-domain-containing protein [Kalaharituber pfeilii]
MQRPNRRLTRNHVLKLTPKTQAPRAEEDPPDFGDSSSLSSPSSQDSNFSEPIAAAYHDTSKSSFSSAFGYMENDEQSDVDGTSLYPDLPPLHNVGNSFMTIGEAESWIWGTSSEEDSLKDPRVDFSANEIIDDDLSTEVDESVIDSEDGGISRQNPAECEEIESLLSPSLDRPPVFFESSPSPPWSPASPSSQPSEYYPSPPDSPPPPCSPPPPRSPPPICSPSPRHTSSPCLSLELQRHSQSPRTPSPALSIGTDSSIDDVLRELDFNSLSVNNSGQASLYQLPFWAQYEATRAALQCCIPFTNLAVSEFLEPIVAKLQTACLARDYQKSWHNVLENHAAECGIKLSKQRMSHAFWNRLQENEQCGNEGKCENLYLTGRVEFEFNVSQRDHPFKILLNPLATNCSNRFWRKFGSDRFLTLSLPHLRKKAPDEVPYRFKALYGNLEKQAECYINFLMQEPGIEVLGRKWRLFQVKYSDRRKKKRSTQAVLFAVTGEGISTPMGIGELLAWHIPLESKNLESTVSKLFSRISLGFTDTIPTVRFTTNQICPNDKYPRRPGDPYTPDPDFRNEDGEVMNDGCSTASPAFFRAIQRRLNLDVAPSAVQGRLGSAKGLWVVDPIYLRRIAEGKADPDAMWIRVTESQAKYQEHQVSEPDEAWVTFDLAACSKPRPPMEINLQLLAVLEHHGVPSIPLKDLIKDHLETQVKELVESMEDPALLRRWIYNRRTLFASRARDGIVNYGGFPEKTAEQLVMLLDAGFDLHNEEWFVKKLSEMIDDFWNSFKDLRIRVPQSTLLFCVADPTNTLEEGEVSLHFSRGMLDPITGYCRSFIEGDILVARNPAQLPSDIQKVKAVYNEKLRDLKDVIVFSTKGKKSLASMLNGGDYDGDKCWICWDQRIVEPFSNDSSVIPTAGFKQAQWFNADLKKVKELIDNPSDKAELAEALIRAGAYKILGSDQMVGIYSNYHKHHAIRHGLGDPISILLAHICAVLLDASKQGLSLKGHSMNRLEGKLKQANRTTKDLRCPDSPAGITAELNDFAQETIAQKKREFQGRFHPQTDHLYADHDLTEKYYTQQQLADQSADQEFKQCLRRLRTALSKIKDAYDVAMRARQVSREHKNANGGLHNYSSQQEEESYESVLSRIWCDYMSIKPIEDLGSAIHPIIRWWAFDADKPDSDWQLLKASCAYSLWKGFRTITWLMCGEQLCILKAKAVGRYRCVVDSMYCGLKMDKKYLSKREDKPLFGSFQDDLDDVLDLSSNDDGPGSE